MSHAWQPPQSTARTYTTGQKVAAAGCGCTALLALAVAAVIILGMIVTPPSPPDDDVEVAEEAAEDEGQAEDEDEGDEDQGQEDEDEDEYDGAPLVADVEAALYAAADELDWPEIAALTDAVSLRSDEPGHITVVVPDGDVPMLGDAGPTVANRCQEVGDLEAVTVDATARGGAEIGPTEVPCLDPDRPEEYPE